MKSRVGGRNKTRAGWSALKAGVCGAVLTVLLAATGTLAQEAPQKPGASPEQQKRLDVMKGRGTEASLTILPVQLGAGGKPLALATAEDRDFRDRITEVVGMFLEMMGLKNIELGKTAFAPAVKTDTVNLASSLAEFVKQHPIATEYVLYAEFSTDGLSAMVADKTGAVVWSDRLTAQDDPFKSGAPEPMAVCEVLVRRLSPQLGLNEQTRKAAKPGKMQDRMLERGGNPPENETAPLPGRQAEMKKAMPKATLVVFSPRVRVAEKTAEAGNAAGLAKLINDAVLGKAAPAKQSPLLTAPQKDPNEVKVLWDLAREFRDYVKKNPVDADYVLYADYRFNPEHWEQGFVHFIVCDRQGEWVFAEVVNSHFPAYQNVKPTSKDDCDKVLVNRLRSCLK